MPTVLITGANRGLGLEFTRQYLSAGWQVIACCRDPQQENNLDNLLKNNNLLDVFKLDVADFSAIDQLADQLDQQPIDLLINNAGIFGPKKMADQDPGQTLGFMDYDLWSEVLRTNTMAPLKLIEALYSNVQGSEQKKIINMSSLAGSLSRGQGELFAYRTSKAALNMVTKILADKTSETGVIATALSPGWVKTEMGGPMADMDSEDSIRQVISLIDRLTAADSGRFYHYQGDAIDW